MYVLQHILRALCMFGYGNMMLFGLLRCCGWLVKGIDGVVLTGMSRKGGKSQAAPCLEKR